tara:strand:- start:700 stop:972 length:273 start_codon:yes stop_codon:yes gene_type:complete
MSYQYKSSLQSLNEREYDGIVRFSLSDLLDKTVTVKMKDGNNIVGRMDFFGVKNNNIIIKDYKELKDGKVILSGSKLIINGKEWSRLYFK